MSGKLIYSVDCEIPGGFSEFILFNSNSSLLDADIILFNTSIGEFRFSHNRFQGKPSLGDDRSLRLREAADHWRREIDDAFRAGKTIFIFLTELEEVFVDTGRREYSGTGRNRHTTHIVDKFDNYRVLPIDISVTTSQGREMTLTPSGAILANYWREFSEHSVYKVLLDGKCGEPLIVTKSGGKVVSSLMQHKESGGTIILLPFLRMNDESFYKEAEVSDPGDGDEGEDQDSGEDADEYEDGEVELSWTTDGIAFGDKLRHCLLEIDAELRTGNSTTPVPEWAKVKDYALPRETEVRQELLVVEGELALLEDRKAQLKDQLLKEGMPKRLLYEKGKPLEAAVLQALLCLGFSAKPYRDAKSEFDVIFECGEGRLIGEVEGKDSKSINIDKLRQLEMNIHEDFERDEVSSMAKGVLFGNAYRLIPIDERGEFFTEKCKTAVVRTGSVLVRTPDLFRIVQYINKNNDEEFARQCREAILSATGQIVEFPDIPAPAAAHDDVQESGAS